MVADERSQEEEPKCNTNRYEVLYLSLTQIELYCNLIRFFSSLQFPMNFNNNVQCFP